MLEKLAFAHLAFYVVLFVTPEIIYKCWKKKSHILVPSVNAMDKIQASGKKPLMKAYSPTEF